MLNLTRRERNRQQAEQIVARISLHLEIETLIRNKAMTHCSIPEEINTILNFDLYTPTDFPEIQEYIPDIPDFPSPEMQWNSTEITQYTQGVNAPLSLIAEAVWAGVPYEELR